MMISMTGYGVARTEDPDVSVTVEVRSVNNRYLKLGFRTPESLSSLEASMEGIVRRHVSRGAITVTVYCRRLGPLARPPINEAVLQAYAEDLKRMAEKFGLAADLGIAALVGLPGVLSEDEQTADVEPVRDRVLATVEAAVEDFKAMRRQEGRALEDDLRTHVQVIRDCLAEVKRLAPLVVEEYRDRLLQRVGVLLQGSPMELARESLLAEVSVFAERSDISEEISRLESHLSQFAELLETDQPAGRKLEFVAQEMLREANTMGAKSGHPDIGRHVIDVKAAIDRIKEQVQNAE